MPYYKFRPSEVKGDRTGTGTKSVFGHQSRYDLFERFPLMIIAKGIHEGHHS